MSARDDYPLVEHYERVAADLATYEQMADEIDRLRAGSLQSAREFIAATHCDPADGSHWIDVIREIEEQP